MILFLLAAAAASPPAKPLKLPYVDLDVGAPATRGRSLVNVPGGEPAKSAACAALSRDDPARAVIEAETWSAADHGIGARQCLGIAYAAAQRWTQALSVLEQAGTQAEARHDARAGVIWSQAGNAGLAAENPARARTALDHAIGSQDLTRTMRGEAFFDRARADVALNEWAIARSDLDQGLQLTPADPFGWLLSATLARRQKDLPRAEKDIGEALRLAPDDASIALEAGNVAAASGVISAARLAWEKAVALGPKEPAGQAAAAALSANRD
jgi:tetratricopeptide (TPR) repeat protein